MLCQLSSTARLQPRGEAQRAGGALRRSLRRSRGFSPQAGGVRQFCWFQRSAKSEEVAFPPVQAPALRRAHGRCRCPRLPVRSSGARRSWCCGAAITPDGDWGNALGPEGSLPIPNAGIMPRELFITGFLLFPSRNCPGDSFSFTPTQLNTLVVTRTLCAPEQGFFGVRRFLVEQILQRTLHPTKPPGMAGLDLSSGRRPAARSGAAGRKPWVKERGAGSSASFPRSQAQRRSLEAETSYTPETQTVTNRGGSGGKGLNGDGGHAGGAGVPSEGSVLAGRLLQMLSASETQQKRGRGSGIKRSVSRLGEEKRRDVLAEIHLEKLPSKIAPPAWSTDAGRNLASTEPWLGPKWLNRQDKGGWL